MSDGRLPTWEEAEARLCAPGSPFETEEALVLGAPMQVYKHRARSLRELIENSRQHGDAEYTVFITEDGKRRPFTFASLEQTAASVATGLALHYGIGLGF